MRTAGDRGTPPSPRWPRRQRVPILVRAGVGLRSLPPRPAPKRPLKREAWHPPPCPGPFGVLPARDWPPGGEEECASVKMGHTVGMKRVVVRTRLAEDELELIDALARDRGLTRSALIRLLVARGLEQAGPPGSLTPYPSTDEGGWPASPEVRLELVRRRLWDTSQAGSALATVALERALARERASTPAAKPVAAEDDPFLEVDELRERREAQRREMFADQFH